MGCRYYAVPQATTDGQGAFRCPCWDQGSFRLAPRHRTRINYARTWGGSSAGRAPRSHRGGQGFDPPPLHHRIAKGCGKPQPFFVPGLRLPALHRAPCLTSPLCRSELARMLLRRIRNIRASPDLQNKLHLAKGSGSRLVAAFADRRKGRGSPQPFPLPPSSGSELVGQPQQVVAAPFDVFQGTVLGARVGPVGLVGQVAGLQQEG